MRFERRRTDGNVLLGLIGDLIAGKANLGRKVADRGQGPGRDQKWRCEAGAAISEVDRAASNETADGQDRGGVRPFGQARIKLVWCKAQVWELTVS